MDLLLCQRSCRPSDRDNKAVGHFACRAKRRRLLKTVEGLRAMTKEMGTKMISQTKPKAEFAANDATHWDVSEQRGSARIAPCLVGVGLALKKVESSCNHNSCMARSAGPKEQRSLSASSGCESSQVSELARSRPPDPFRSKKKI